MSNNKFYNRKEVFEKYEYGDYKIFVENGKRIGKYYNSDSNKWVNRLNKKVIEKKYIRYEFSCYDDREILKDFRWSDVDRVGKYLYIIYKKGIYNWKRKNDRWVYLDKEKDEISILGYDYYVGIRKDLENKGIIESKVVGKNYGKEIRLYKLRDDFYESSLRREVWIRNSKLIKTLDKRINKIIEKDELIGYEIECCKELNISSVVDIDGLVNRRLKRKLNEIRDELSWDYIGKKRRNELERFLSDENIIKYKDECRKRFELLKSELKELKENGSVIEVFDRDNFGNRLYNIINNKDKEFREVLLLDNESLVEVDMINGYVSLLLRIFKGIENDNDRYKGKFDEKIRDLVEDKNGSDFIEKYEDICFTADDRIDFYRYVWLKLGLGMSFNKEDRRYIKSLILSVINGKDDLFVNRKFGNRNMSINEFGKKVFGNGYECMNKLKNLVIEWNDEKSYYGFEKYINMSKILSKMEVIIMSERMSELKKNNIKYISLFDGILVKKSEKDKVLKIMNKKYLSDVDEIVRFK